MDYYHVLGVSRSATKEEIKNAFSKLAVIYQPDKNSQASHAIRDHTTVRFKQVSEAYEVLIDNTRRARYDRDLSSSLSHSSSSSHSSTGKSPGSKVYRYRYEYTYNGNGRPFFIVTGVLFGLYLLKRRFRA